MVLNTILCSIGTPEDEARTLESWSWIQALEKINHALEEPRSKVRFIILIRSFANKLHFRGAQVIHSISF